MIAVISMATPEQKQTLKLVDRLLARLSRVTSSGSFVPEIDGLRFFAIMGVILFHINGYVQRKQPHLEAIARNTFTDRMFTTGCFGVELFFVISGFILSMPFASQHLFPKQKKKVALKGYYLRRLSRLEPPYFTNLLILALMHAFVFGHYSIHRTLCHFVASMFYVHNIVYGVPSLINIPAWSLEVEVQFYILAPLIALLYKVRSRLIRLLSFFLLPVLVALAGHIAGLPVIRLNILGTLVYFMMGFVLTDIFLLSWNKGPARTWRWDIIGTAAWLILLIALLQGWQPRVVYTPPLILIAYMAAFRGVVWNAIVRNRWLVVTGGMCYTLYLYHDLLVGLFGKATLHLTGLTHSWWSIMAIQLTLLLPLTIAGCALMFIWFEKPFMYKDWPRRWAMIIRKRIGLVK